MDFGGDLNYCLGGAYLFLGCQIFYWDIRHLILPDWLTLGSWAAGFLFAVIMGSAVLNRYCLGTLAALSIFLPVFLLQKGKLGGGDVKLSLLIGGLCGPRGMFTAHLVSVFLALLGILLLSSIKKKVEKIPFGPFLWMGGAVSLFLTGGIK